MGKKDWLSRAMVVLRREGGSRFTIDYLCRGLGVTKGSFYAHFADRMDFVGQLVDYWAETFTKSVIVAIDEKRHETPEARLFALMQLLNSERMVRYDVAIRAWAVQEPSVAKGVREVDEQRYNYVRQIFHDMGFRGSDLDIRTQLFVVYHSTELGTHLPVSGLNTDEEIRLRHALFTRP